MFKFSKDENVECIYFISCNNNFAVTTRETLENNLIVLNVIYSSPIINSDLDEQLDEYRTMYQNKESIEKFGIKIWVEGRDSIFYRGDHGIHGILEGSISRENENYLYNSIILYDKDKIYTEIKERIELSKKRYYTPWVYAFPNRIEIVPSLVEALDNTLNIMKAEDTQMPKIFEKK